MREIVIPASQIQPGDEIADSALSWARVLRVTPAVVIDSSDEPPITRLQDELCRVRRPVSSVEQRLDDVLVRLRRLESLICQS